VQVFWLMAAALTGLCILALLLALRPRAATVPASVTDTAFYRAQVAEIARQEAAGMLGHEEAEAARVEAARRLLAAQKLADGPAPADTRRSRTAAALVTLVAVPAVALGLYTVIGEPRLPAQPLASRAPPAPADEFGAMLARIEEHLRKNPDDARGHELLVPVYLRLGRHEDAVRAQQRVIALKGPTADREADLGEILAVLKQGRIEGEPAAAFQRALKLDPSNVKARFYSGLGSRQAGDNAAARGQFEALLAESIPPDLREELQRQMAALGAPVPGSAAPPETGPGSEAGAAIAALPPEARLEAVRGMVEALASRLATTGGSAADWARLIRSLGVLGEHDRRGMIAAEARQKFAADPAALALIEQALGARSP
jgi:cytochrome c-type biogenesis protein CcmH